MTEETTLTETPIVAPEGGWSGDASDWFGEEQATFGDRLAGAREAAGMSQKALAGRLGIRVSTLRKWEEDRSEPRSNRLQMLSGILGVSLSWLITGRGEGPDMPEDTGTMPVDVAAALAEVRAVRTQMTAAADRLAQIEKALRKQLGG